jgi:hypothetical protein
MHKYLMKSKEARLEVLGYPFKDKNHVATSVAFFNLSYGWKTVR